MKDTVTYAAKADQTAEKIFVIEPAVDYSDALMLGTLQGLAANKGTEQIMFSAGAFDAYLITLQKSFGCKVVYKDGEGEKWTPRLLLAYFAQQLDGYILADTDPENEGTYVALSVAASLNAVVVTKENEQTARDAGLAMLLDARELDDAWLRRSVYWNNIRRDIAVEQVLTEAPRLVDYAVMAGAYFSFYNGSDENGHTEKYSFLDEGAIVYGWNGVLGEYRTVKSYGSINVCLVPADHAYNLSTLSGFDLFDIKQGTKDLSEKYSERKHTVCLIMSDGDNLQWLLNGFAADSKWYNSQHRGRFSLGWGLPATAIDVAAPMLEYVYGEMSREDEFIMQLSGLGYTFPSQWNKAELEKMAEKLSSNMERMDMKYAEILDDNAFEKEYFDPFTKQEGIDGVFYIDYWDYSGMKGRMLWSNGKPVVSARYRLWADLEDGQIDAVAKSINNASTDPTDENAYSFVIVHCWSGLDSNGSLVPDGNTMDAVNELVDRLGKDVDVVTPSEFMTRIRANLG